MGWGKGQHSLFGHNWAQSVDTFIRLIPKSADLLTLIGTGPTVPSR